MMGKTCYYCGKKLGALTFSIKDGDLCDDCFERATMFCPIKAMNAYMFTGAEITAVLNRFPKAPEPQTKVKFDKKTCCICGKKVGFFDLELKDGKICDECCEKAEKYSNSAKFAAFKYTRAEIMALLKSGPAFAQGAAPQQEPAAAEAKPEPTPAAPATPNATAENVAADLMTYKKLLDAGAITQEEYDAKKKQILGL